MSLPVGPCSASWPKIPISQPCCASAHNARSVMSLLLERGYAITRKTRIIFLIMNIFVLQTKTFVMTRVTRLLPKSCFCLRQSGTLSSFSLRVLRSTSAKHVKNIIRKYHAAVDPEPACPELVEGSKGRLIAILKWPPRKLCYERYQSVRGRNREKRDDDTNYGCR